MEPNRQIDTRGVCRRWLIIIAVATAASATVTAFASAALCEASPHHFRIAGKPELFAPAVVSTAAAEIRLTISPDGRTALWFSRDRAGGAGGYDIWMSRHVASGWGDAVPVPFNSIGRDFDPAFSADGRFVYFSSDRPGGAGGDDIYRVAVTGEGFGPAENLGASVNSAGNEFAPMLSRDGGRLLFSSDRAGGKGGHDLFIATFRDNGFASARRLGGEINTGAHEFDATFLDDDAIVFARAQDFSSSRVDLFYASAEGGAWDSGQRLPDPVNDAAGNTYGAMLDWSQPGRLLFSARRDPARGMDLYSVPFARDAKACTPAEDAQP